MCSRKNRVWTLDNTHPFSFYYHAFYSFSVSWQNLQPVRILLHSVLSKTLMNQILVIFIFIDVFNPIFNFCFIFVATEEKIAGQRRSSLSPSMVLLPTSFLLDETDGNLPTDYTDVMYVDVSRVFLQRWNLCLII